MKKSRLFGLGTKQNTLFCPFKQGIHKHQAKDK